MEETKVQRNRWEQGCAKPWQPAAMAALRAAGRLRGRSAGASQCRLALLLLGGILPAAVLLHQYVG